MRVFLFLTCSTILLTYFCVASVDAPLSVYLTEGFDGGSIPAGWSVHRTTGTLAAWTVVGVGTNPPITPHTGSGQAKFNSYEAAAGEQARLITPRVDLSSSVDPYFEFFMYHDDEFSSNQDSVYLEATTGDSISGPWTLIAGIRRYQSVPGWRKEAASLLPFRGVSRVFFCFRGVSGYGNNMYLDDVSILDSAFHDIGMISLISSGGAQSAQGIMDGSRQSVLAKKSTTRFETMFTEDFRALTLSAVIRNYGSFVEPSYQIQWMVDSQMQPPIVNSNPLPPGTTDTLSLPWLSPSPGAHVIVSWTDLAGDSNTSNDTAEAIVQVVDSNVVFLETFNDSTFPPAGWTVVNRDGGIFPAWFRGSATSPFLPFEGSGFAGNNFQRANNLYIDDYLISPPIPGVGAPNRMDTLRFYTRSVLQPPPQANFPDSLMVLLSTSGVDTSSFTIIVDYFEVPKSGWSLRQYPLTSLVPPNSTVHAAFRYLHFNGGFSGTSSDFLGIDAVQVARTISTHVSPTEERPSTFTLMQNYPNPFNPTTTIQFGLPVAANVTVRIYNVLGQEVATLVDGPQSAGTFQAIWNGRNSAGAPVASGMYFYSLVAKSADGKSSFTNIKKMLLLK